MPVYRIAEKLKGIIGLMIGLVIIFPLYYALSFSFMPYSDIVAYPPKLFPRAFTAVNYIQVFNTIPIMKFIINSLIVCASVIAMQIITASLAAYGFVFFNFPAKKALFITVLATMMIPGEAIIISNFLTISSFGLLDHYLGLILPYGTSAMAIFLIRQYYMTMPAELKEASLIDGCGNLQFFFNILFPLSTPVISALVVYIFIGTWNQYMWPLLITNSANMRTVQIGIAMLQFSDGISYGLVCAGCVLIILPTALIFLFGHQKLVTGITAGSIKG